MGAGGEVEGRLFAVDTARTVGGNAVADSHAVVKLPRVQAVCAAVGIAHGISPVLPARGGLADIRHVAAQQTIVNVHAQVRAHDHGLPLEGDVVGEVSALRLHCHACLLRLRQACGGQEAEAKGLLLYVHDDMVIRLFCRYMYNVLTPAQGPAAVIPPRTRYSHGPGWSPAR